MSATFHKKVTRLPNKWSARFVVMLPQFRRTVRYALRNAPRYAHQEDMAECIANAFCAFAGLVRRGKGHLAFPSVLARFAVMQLRDGRTVGSRLNSQDLMSRYAKRRHGIEVLPLVQQTPSGTWEEIVVEDRHAGPAEVAACRLDFKAWLRKLDRKRRAVVACLAAGEGTNETARRFQLTPARISQLRGELKRSWEEFQGDQPVRVAA